jgi:threonine/homoserine/homoserine lactone efflux protein
MANLAAFVTYAIVTTFTPGPNNLMALANASKHGFRRSTGFNLGVGAGFLVLLSISEAFSAALYGLLPTVKPFMLALGAGYMLWLAWHVWRSKPDETGSERTQLNFFTATVLQFINPKGVLYAVTLATTFLRPGVWTAPELMGIVVGLSALGVAATSCWALGGALFQRAMARHASVVNAIMALLLVYCAVSLFLPH